MKVLITGKNSYIGKNIGNFLLYKNMEVKYVSVRNGISEDEFTECRCCSSLCSYSS